MVMTAEGPDIRTILKRMPNTVRVGNQAGGLSEFISIQAAVDYCDAQTGDWVIELYQGTYDEGDITPNGGANITIAGLGIQRVTIAPVAAPANAVIVSGSTLSLQNIVVTAPDATAPALRVTGGNCVVDTCFLNGFGAGDAIQQHGGTLQMLVVQSLAGDIDLSTGICTLHMASCEFNGTFDTVGAFAHVVTFFDVDFNNNAMNLLATGACTYDFDGVFNIGLITDASVGGTVQMARCYSGGGMIKNGTSPWTIANCETLAVSNTNAAGAVTIYGGIVLSYGRAVGPIINWLDTNTIKVMPCTTITDTIIQWAINAAAAGDTIVIHPGTYEEAVVLAAGINLTGLDREDCIIDIDHATLITMAAGCSVSKLTLNVTSDATGSGYGVECNDADCTIEDCNFVLNRTAGAIAVGISENTGATARTINIRNVRMWSTINTNITCVYILQAGKDVYIENCWCLGGDRGLRIEAASDVWTHSNYWETLTGGSAVVNTAGNLYIKDDAIHGTMVCTSNTVYRDGRDQLHVFEGMVIQDAIDDASAGDVILVHPGTYTEQITMVTGVDIISIAGYQRTTIAWTLGAEDEIVVFASNATLKGFTITITCGGFRPRAIQTTVAGFVARDCIITAVGPGPGAYLCYIRHNSTLYDCVVDSTSACTNGIFSNLNCTITCYRSTLNAITNSINSAATGAIYLYDNCRVTNRIYTWSNIHISFSTVEEIHCYTGAVVIYSYNSRHTGNIITADAVVHNLTFKNCTLDGNSILSGATGATTLNMDGCAEVGTVSNAGTGAFNIQNSDVASVSQTNAAGSIAIVGGTLLACAGATGSVTWQTGPGAYAVLGAMKIDDVIAADRYIYVYPGTYTYAAQTLVDQPRVTIQGSGKNTIITTNTADLDIIHVTAVDVTFLDFVVDGDAGGVASDIGIYVEAADRFVARNVTCRDNGEHGFLIYNTDYAKLADCDALANTLDGIRIEGGAGIHADYNSVVNCTSTGNGSDGVEIIEGVPGLCVKNIILGNQLIGNTGVNLNDGGTNTELGHNVTV